MFVIHLVCICTPPSSVCLHQCVGAEQVAEYLIQDPCWLALAIRRLGFLTWSSYSRILVFLYISFLYIIWWFSKYMYRKSQCQDHVWPLWDTWGCRMRNQTTECDSHIDLVCHLGRVQHHSCFHCKGEKFLQMILPELITVLEILQRFIFPMFSKLSRRSRVKMFSWLWAPYPVKNSFSRAGQSGACISRSKNEFHLFCMTQTLT